MSKQILFNIKLKVDGKEQLTTATADLKILESGGNQARKATSVLPMP